MELRLVLPHWIRVDLGVMVMKQYFRLFKSPELEPQIQMQLSVIPRIYIVTVETS